jgi:hypothetical protein
VREEGFINLFYEHIYFSCISAVHCLILLLTFDGLFRWISIGSDLKYDARRDLDDVGAKCVEGNDLHI